MSQRSMRAAINLVVAIAMTVGMLLSSAHVVAGHNPYAIAFAEATRHAELATEVADHGHSHEEGDEFEQRPGHVHGHNPGDHVHEPFALTALVTPKLPNFVASNARPGSETSDLDVRSSLKRPPRSIVG